MKIRLLNLADLDKIKNLYEEIKAKTFTLWDDGYPSEELIKYDIERQSLYGVFDKENLIAISFAGVRCEDGEESFTWKDTFNKRGTFARIGVSPEHQNKGVATKLVQFILDKLKKDGFDGVRILVGTNNYNALKLYNKFNFDNCGKTERFGHDYYLFELRIREKGE